MLDVLEAGSNVRHVAATRVNKESSRSHTIFILRVNQKLPNGSEKHGILYLVDLAGSEKVGKTGATGETLEEAKKINGSLSALGNVIHALVLKASHIPYRDSKLTRILQESLGGNYKTSLVVTCSTHSTQKEETISTLRFAQRARSIKNQVRINIQNSPQQLQAMIMQLKYELGCALSQVKILKELLERNGIEYNNVSNPSNSSPCTKTKIKPMSIILDDEGQNSDETIFSLAKDEILEFRASLCPPVEDEESNRNVKETFCDMGLDLHNAPRHMYIKPYGI